MIKMPACAQHDVPLLPLHALRLALPARLLVRACFDAPAVHYVYAVLQPRLHAPASGPPQDILHLCC